MERNIPSLDKAYDRLRPVFFAALGSLSRRGLLVGPSDGMDLIHDFLIEGWAGLEKNFDPAKGSFEGYAYGAFVQFARPRIVRLTRWQNSLMEEEGLELFAAKTESASESADLELVRQSFGRLSAGDQEVLSRVFAGDYGSERSLARDLGISRYRVREILVDALGHLAVSFDRPAGITPQDWGVARALWGERRTVDETATVLQLTTQQVRAGHRRYAEFLSEGLKQYQSQTWSPQRREKMSSATKTQMKSTLSLLEKALASPNDPALLVEVRKNACDILKALEELDSPAPPGGFAKSSPEWTAQVYQAIFLGAGAELQPDVAAAESVEAHRSEDAKIGEAFRDVLLADLSGELRFPTEISSLSEISILEQKRLGRAPDVDAALPVSHWWLMHGVRPLTVFYATKAVAGLLERYQRRGALPKGDVVLGTGSSRVVDEANAAPIGDLLGREIARRAECSPEIATGLYSWLLRVAAYKPWLFAGFETKVLAGGKAIRLTPSSEKAEETYSFWGLASDNVNAARTLASLSS